KHLPTVRHIILRWLTCSAVHAQCFRNAHPVLPHPRSREYATSMDTSTPGFVIADDHKQRLELIVSEWQIAADLAFCDVVLWYPHEGTFIAHAQARPVTAQTTLPQDMTGS